MTGETLTLTITATQPGDATIIVTASDEGSATADTFSVMISATPVPAITATKTTTFDQVVPGKDITYTIKVTNGGVRAATGVVITEAVPPNTTSATNAGWVVEGTTDPCKDQAAGTSCTIDLGRLGPNGGSQQPSFTLTVDRPFPVDEDDVCNQGTVSGDNFDDVDTNQICTPVNKNGTIIIIKQTDPDGATGSFSFSGALSGTISDGEQLMETLAAGQHTVTEMVPTGWALTDITCDDTDSSGNTGTATATFVVSAGETVKCVFTNTACLECGFGDDEADKVSELTLRYNGSGPVNVNVYDDCKLKREVFNGTVSPGETFTIFSSTIIEDKFSNTICFYVDLEINAELHTSCSQPLGPGTIAGDFEVCRQG